jgi:hypothetical protein
LAPPSAVVAAWKAARWSECWPIVVVANALMTALASLPPMYGRVSAVLYVLMASTSMDEAVCSTWTSVPELANAGLPMKSAIAAITPVAPSSPPARMAVLASRPRFSLAKARLSSASTPPPARA